MSSFASVCVLSYERPELLRACLESLRDAHAGFELIVHDDGSEMAEVHGLLMDLQHKGGCGTLILNPPGHNEGVGEAVRKCFAAAQGDLLVKVDQDLVFVPGWLKETRRILEDPTVGAVGMFPYHHDPVDVEKTRVIDGERDGHFYVTDFVGSCFAVPRPVYEVAGPIESHSPAFSEDVGLKERIRAAGYELALPDEALAVNVGFGIGPSTVNVAHEQVQDIFRGPRLFDGEWS